MAFGLADEAVAPVGAEEVVGALGASGDVGAALDLDFPVELDESGVVFQVPSERAEKGVEKILPQAGFGIGGVGELLEIAVETRDQPIQFRGEGLKCGLWHCAAALAGAVGIGEGDFGCRRYPATRSV